MCAEPSEAQRKHCIRFKAFVRANNLQCYICQKLSAKSLFYFIPIYNAKTAAGCSGFGINRNEMKMFSYLKSVFFCN